MSKQTNIIEWLRQCPQLSSLFAISAEQSDGASLIIPAGSSPRRNMKEQKDVAGFYEADIVPTPSVYEEYQINCYKAVYNNENTFNVLKLEEVEEAIKWINAQDDAESFPDIPDETVIAVETFPFIPQIRGIDPDSGTVCYYITLRITYVNRYKGRYFECRTM